MSDSNYYFTLMCSYSRSKRNFQEKKLSYENYVKKLKKLSTDFDLVITSLKTAEKKFLEGGYRDRGVPLDRGVLKTNYLNLEKNMSTLENIIKNTEGKIFEFKTQINKYAKLYEDAKNNYDKTKK